MNSRNAILPIGLVTGSMPFAGLPTNPAELVLPSIDGMVVGGVQIRAIATPVSHARLPSLLPSLVDQFRPVFVLALGVALGAPVVRVEKIAVNACHFGVPDNEGAQPLGGVPIDPEGPAARLATWDADAVQSAILAAGVPARVPFHAGTHLCNLTLYTYLAALERRGMASPCGFLHLPYLPEQIVWLMRQKTNLSAEQPSMALETQVAAVRAVIEIMAAHARPAAASTRMMEGQSR